MEARLLRMMEVEEGLPRAAREVPGSELGLKEYRNERAVVEAQEAMEELVMVDLPFAQYSPKLASQGHPFETAWRMDC